MRLAVLTGSLTRLAGGTYSSIRRPMQEMYAQFRPEMGIFGVWDRFSAEDLPKWAPLEPAVFKAYGPRGFGFAPGMLPAVQRFRPELIQVHGIWMHYSVVSLTMHRRLATPHMVHLHGMLDRWAVHHSAWKKRLAGRLYELEHLRTASCLRALCEAEVQAIRALGLKGRVCQIPNGIDLPEDRPAGPAPWGNQVPAGKKVLLFLSRIHEKKGLPHLIDAWAQLMASDRALASDWELVIAGWDTTGHQPQLERRVEALGVGDSVKFVGPLFDDDKEAGLRNASAFVLPSHSEGLPMTVLEAWANRLPVVMTPECNLPEGFQTRSALPVHASPRSILDGLRQLMSMRDEERAAMGARGRDLVAERFNWKSIARQMNDVNEWILGGGDPPDCVV